jgi:putative ABC transport system ATP-binding protein
MSNPVLELHSVSKRYRSPSGEELFALRDVNLTINAGEFVSIMGPSGSGKTTLANIVGLLSEPSDGQVKFLNYKIRDMSDKDRTKLRRAYLGFVFQDYMLIEHLNVVENVMLALTLSRYSRRRIRHKAEELLVRVGLTDHIRKFPRQLSGGQKQRVAIARALIKKPRLILADEPAGALDPTSRREVLGLLQELNMEKQSTIVMVTHTAEDALAGTRLVQMQNTRIVADKAIQNRHDFRLGA